MMLSTVWDWMTPDEKERWQVLGAQNAIIAEAWRRTQSDKLSTDLAYIASEMAQIEGAAFKRKESKK